MAIGLTSALNNAKSSLLVRQKELNLIANNLSNSSVEGYHRQTVQLAENLTQTTLDGMYGTGVHIATIVRSYDETLENSLQSALSQQGYQNEYMGLLENMENIVAPNGTSPLSSAMTAFNSAVQQVKSSPENISYRTALISSARTLVNEFNSEYNSMGELRDNVATGSGTKIADLTTESVPPAVTDTIVEEATGAAFNSCEDINKMLSQITDLNQQIYTVETNNRFANSDANDLRDQRDQLVKEIAKFVDITVSENADARYDISLQTSDGTTIDLIKNDEGSKLSADPNLLTAVIVKNPTIANPDYDPADPASSETMDNPDLENGFLSFTVLNEKENTYTNTFSLSAESGNLGALAEGRVYINGKMDEMRNYAVSLTEGVNAILTAGEDLNGDAGLAMFDTMDTTTITAGNLNMSVNAALTASKIGASDVDPADPDAKVEQGNGKNMGNLVTFLNSDATINGDTSSYLAYANKYINSITQDVSSMESSLTVSENLVLMYQNAIASISGVNMDEEMTSMLEVQRIYQASAKVITTVDTMFETILSMK